MDVKKKIPLIFGAPGKKFLESFSEAQVFVAELRPGLEGMLGVSEAFLKKGVQPVVICDNMMAFCMERGLVSRVYIFYQSIDKETAACRTGSLIAALCAAFHGIPVEAHRAAPLKKAPSLLKIAGQSVTAGHLKTYAPLTEKVPLSTITEICHA